MEGVNVGVEGDFRVDLLLQVRPVGYEGFETLG